MSQREIRDAEKKVVLIRDGNGCGYYIGITLAITWVIPASAGVAILFNSVVKSLGDISAEISTVMTVMFLWIWIIVAATPACWLMRICGNRHGRTPMADVFDPFDIGLDERYK